MDESSWMVSDDPAAMLRYLNRGIDIQEVSSGHMGTPVPKPSDRKLRLFACACCREWKQADDEIIDRWEERGHPLNPDALRWARNWADEPWSGDAPSQDIRAALLRDIFGNPFRPVVLPIPDCYSCAGTRRIPHSNGGDKLIRCIACDGKGTLGACPWLTWNNGVIPAMAQAIYDERRFDKMPILADALKEAGCDNADLLNHCWGLARCGGCKGTGQRDCMVDAGYGNSLMKRQGWQHCYVCNLYPDAAPATQPGWVKSVMPCVRGCHVIDCFLGKN